MATDSSKKTCIKCVKGSGIVTCDGCYQSFCNKHLYEHRQEILGELDQLNENVKTFEKDLVVENDPSPIYSAIDQWETDSIEKIRKQAQVYRDEVKQLTNKTINDFNKYTKKIQSNIKSSKEKNDFTEIDVRQWNQQLDSLKQLLSDPFPISLGTDPKNPANLHFIMINYQSPLKFFNKNKFQEKEKKSAQTKPQTFQTEAKVQVDIDERFDKIAGHAILSDDDAIVSFVGFSSAQGYKSYSTKIHQIRLEILEQKHQGLFIGIISSKQKITARSSELATVYGWRDFDKQILNGNAQLNNKKTQFILANDQLTFIIDCEHYKIALIHHRLNQKLLLAIDTHKCPFPWKFLLTSYGEDVVAINES